MTHRRTLALPALLLCAALLGAAAAPARRRVTIVESSSAMWSHDMDRVWMEIAAGLGFDARIVPQSTLDGLGFAASTDVLIVASGVIALPKNRVDTLIAYLKTGGRVYLQAEYLESYAATAAFARIVNELGARFAYVEETHEDLFPMEILGRWAAGPRPVASIPYFWHGVAGEGSGPGLEPFLRWKGRYYGWAYQPPGLACAMIVSTTDQDWVLSRKSPALMTNIVAALGDRAGCQGEAPPGAKRPGP